MHIFLALFAIAIGLSSVSSKAAGLAWLWIVLSGVFFFLKSRRQPVPTEGSLKSQDIATQTVRWWAWACLFAFVWMAIPTLYWSGPWPERHPQWRLLLGAVGVWLLLRYRAPTGRSLQVLASAAAVASLLAYALVITVTSNAAPTNRIPWMAGLSLLSCALLTLSYGVTEAPQKLRQFWLGASALMLVTVLLSGVRGSFPLLLIWPVTLLAMHSTDPGLWRSTWRWLLPLMILLFAIGLPLIPEDDNPVMRVFQVFFETGAVKAEGPFVPESSSGIRLILYRTALQQGFEHALWGVGSVAAKGMISQALMAAGITDSNVVFGIAHFHSDLLNAWVEFGILGLLGYLSYWVGMLCVAWWLKRSLAQPTLALGVLALALVHLATGLSNMNLAHNYYPTLLAISMALIFSVSQRKTDLHRIRHHSAKPIWSLFGS